MSKSSEDGLGRRRRAGDEIPRLRPDGQAAQREGHDRDLLAHAQPQGAAGEPPGPPLWWPEGDKYVKMRLSTRALKTIAKYGLNTAAKKYDVDLEQFAR